MFYWLTLLITPIVAISLAGYGWHLLRQLARRREAYDLYTASQSLLEQLDADGRHAWENHPQFLNDYTEQKLLSKTSAIEQRLELLRKYYGYPVDAPKITNKQLSDLRKLLTTAPDLLPREKRDRTIAIHRITVEMVSILLEQNYAYINKSSWQPVKWILLAAAFAVLWVAVYYLYALVSIGPWFFAAPVRVVEWLPLAMLGVVTPGLWALFRPWRLASGARRGIVVGYIAAMPVAFSLALGLRMLVSPLVWMPGVAVILLAGMALGRAGGGALGGRKRRAGARMFRRQPRA